MAEWRPEEVGTEIGARCGLPLGTSTAEWGWVGSCIQCMAAGR